MYIIINFVLLFIQWWLVSVLLLILVTVGVCLIVLLVVCFVLACMRRGEHSRGPPLGAVPAFRRYRDHGTGDKRAMISIDTSSEGSVDQTPPAYIKQVSHSYNKHLYQLLS